ncbi:unnamed protein product [Brachionus calyciflorus]|uniref:Uncharacterized protein n=1 Tax=Brachionus calyciflorus TaxID=104777 RepID=A0A814MBZ2_9BILA|nr:unnamed protein product [Brachionus calyciflorus]
MQLSNETVNIGIKTLKEHYERTFCTRNRHETFGDTLDEQFVKAFIYKHQNVKFDHKIDKRDIEEIFKNLPNGKAIGTSGVSNEMLKYVDNKFLYY